MRMIRTLSIAVTLSAVAVAALTAGTSGSAWADPPDQLNRHGVRHLTLSPKPGTRPSFGALRATNSGSRQEISPFVVPPGGSCDYSDAHGTGLAHYVDGHLTTVEWNYFGSVLCATTAPGQSMLTLVDTATLFFRRNYVDEGSSGVCQYPVNNPCTLASSSGSWACAGATNCAGEYYIGNFVQMTLPEGWVWNTAPIGCSVADAFRTLYCSAFSQSFYVSPTG
jgi:hypothetical protein